MERVLFQTDSFRLFIACKKVNMQSLRNLPCPKKYDNDDSENASWTDEDASKLVVSSPNDISRWICMMNQSKNVNIAFLQILKEIEENIIERVDIFQKDLESKIEMKLGETKKPQTVFTNANVKELIKELGVQFPLQDLESFEAFDNELENEPDKQDALRELLLHKIDGTSSLTRDLYQLMNYVLAEPVQIKYTWLGKKFRGQQKKNFSLTNTYLCIEDVLTHKHKEPKATLKLNSKFSHYFARVNFKNKPVNLITVE